MSASLVLQGGRVWSPSSPGRVAEAIAIDGETIVAVGTDVAIAEHRGPRTRVIDLKGRLAIPAFGDAHIHAIGGGLESLRCDLAGLRSRADILDAIARYAATLGPEDWVNGGGWTMAAFPGGTPTAADLDTVCGGRPAFLPNRDHHSGWANSVALARAGIDARTPDPADGRIERDEQGCPTGALHEGAMALVARLTPTPSPADKANALRAALGRLHGVGITHFQDACIGNARELGLMDTYDAYRAADHEGWLTARVRGALWWDRTKGIEQLTHLETRRELAGNGAFQATSVKMMMDGVCETFTAAMGSPYLGEPGQHGSHAGDLFVEPDAAAEAVRTLDAAGFQVHFHAIGDRAVRVALDAVASLPVERRGMGRHHLAHLQFIAPEDLRRFADLGVIANFQPLWACADAQMEELTIPFVGEERSGWQYSIGAVHATGARVAFGSDWPVSSPDPLQEIHVAVNRTLSTRLGDPRSAECTTPFRADQALALPDALAAFTAGVAFVNGDEARLGALEAGMLGDVVVLDQDLFEVSPSAIGDTSVDLTVAAGQVVSGDE
jgi:predicted amidohydrolase YtcJ